MRTVPFAEWTPDLPDLANGARTITNALPAAIGYEPFPSLNVLSGALNSRPLGVIEALDRNGTYYQYAGTATKLYQLNTGTMNFDDVTNSGGDYVTASGETWEFAQWKNKILGVNWDDDPQQITMGGANFSDLTTAFRARNIAVVGDFVVASNTYDSSDGNVPNRVRWSAIGDETDWTVSSSTLSDFRDLPTGGPIRKVVGGETGIIVCDSAIYRMDYIGAPAVFKTDEILSGIGTLAKGSVTKLGDSIFLLSRQGFLEITGNGTGINRIGAGKVDKTILADLDHGNLDRISATPDPVKNRIAWAYPNTSATSGRPNRIVVYDRNFDKWSLGEEDLELITSSKGIPITLDELPLLGYTDLDAMSLSLDDPSFKSGLSTLAGFDENFKIGYFRGANKTATLETGEVELNPGFRSSLNAFTPLIDGGTVTGEVGTRDRLADTVGYGSSLTLSASGRFTERNAGRYHRFRLTVSSTWNDGLGVMIDPRDAKRVGRRP